MSFANLFSMTPTPESAALFSAETIVSGLGPCKPLNVFLLSRLRDEAYRSEMKSLRGSGLPSEQLAAAVIQVHERYAKGLWQDLFWRVHGDAELFGKAMHLCKLSATKSIEEQKKLPDLYAGWQAAGDSITGENRHECDRVLVASFYLSPIPEKKAEEPPENPPVPA